MTRGRYPYDGQPGSGHSARAATAADRAVRRSDAIPASALSGVDYKTTGGRSTDVRSWRLHTARHGPAMMAPTTAAALLYAGAVHRLLRWRQPDSIGGSYGRRFILFVRGLAGPKIPQSMAPCGVLAAPPDRFIELSACRWSGPETHPGWSELLRPCAGGPGGSVCSRFNGRRLNPADVHKAEAACRSDRKSTSGSSLPCPDGPRARMARCIDLRMSTPLALNERRARSNISGSWPEPDAWIEACKASRWWPTGVTAGAEAVRLAGGILSGRSASRRSWSVSCASFAAAAPELSKSRLSAAFRVVDQRPGAR